MFTSFYLWMHAVVAKSKTEFMIVWKSVVQWYQSHGLKIKSLRTDSENILKSVGKMSSRKYTASARNQSKKS